MRLYLESNFLVELALEQEQSESCEALLAHAEQQRVELAMPAFAVMESLGAVNRRLGGFKALDENVNRALAQLGRNKADSLRRDLGIELPDAVMLACVIFDLSTNPPQDGALFANRNTKDFDDPLVRDSLRELGCTLIFSFVGAAAKLESTRAS